MNGQAQIKVGSRIMMDYCDEQLVGVVTAINGSRATIELDIDDSESYDVGLSDLELVEVQ